LLAQGQGRTIDHRLGLICEQLAAKAFAHSGLRFLKVASLELQARRPLGFGGGPTRLGAGAAGAVPEAVAAFGAMIHRVARIKGLAADIAMAALALGGDFPA